MVVFDLRGAEPADISTWEAGRWATGLDSSR